MPVDPNGFRDGYEHFWEDRWQNPAGVVGTSTHGVGAQFYHDAVREILRDIRGKSIVDVGCGSLEQWPAQCPIEEAHFVGADVSQACLDLAAQKWPLALFLKIDTASQLAWKQLPGSDLVTCTDVFNHIRPEHFETAVSSLLFAANHAVLIRMWTKAEWDGIGGYHWSHTLPEREGWDLQIMDTPDEAAPWKLHYYRRRENAKTA